MGKAKEILDKFREARIIPNVEVAKMILKDLKGIVKKIKLMWKKDLHPRDEQDLRGRIQDISAIEMGLGGLIKGTEYSNVDVDTKFIDTVLGDLNKLFKKYKVK